MPYCTYLRKSRADAEAEARGEGETLERHRKILFDLAKRLHLDVTKEYAEIVSGETIASRPVVQELLADVEQGLWNGVLVVEVERLARGDTIDQGIIAQTFKFSDTKIITPMKTYDQMCIRDSASCDSAQPSRFSHTLAEKSSHTSQCLNIVLLHSVNLPLPRLVSQCE